MRRVQRWKCRFGWRRSLGLTAYELFDVPVVYRRAWLAIAPAAIDRLIARHVEEQALSRARGIRRSWNNPVTAQVGR
ncbi:MAG: hypothetical protein FWD57_02150 [Polyangiaceae bacterium]|nr:hypothetical protein [Polyangiaceae bacterium]